MSVVVETKLPLPLLFKGKVRDIYDLGDELLIVSTDRISAFDVVLPTPIPGKGKILNLLSAFWFERTKGIVPNHLITVKVEEFPEELREHAELLRDRAMLVRKAKRLPIECIVRGYLTGSGWRDYQRTGQVCGIKLPPGLRHADKLPEPIFTPSTKAETGHDENITFERMCDIVGRDLAERMRELSLRIYEEASRYAESRGIIIADTKFEFGLVDGELILIDELLTPDSSRFWPADSYQPGKPQPSFDKQFLRDYLESLDWDKTPPGPELPPDVVEATRRRYIEAYERLTGKKAPL
ncbi:MAG TPA: phosphoribosylaminoimidazolesuccinocarboxamide synthase [Armatimonadetes bacterium]|nr:phosphoribosylaminoimidazolesuccinocarboxamide synthase [Armatimonadota bacterium]